MRLCFLGNLQSVHLQRWLKHFIARGHEVHYIGLKPEPLRVPGVRAHWLDAQAPVPPASAIWLRRKGQQRHWPAGCGTLRCGWQWRRAGLRALVQRLKPDLVHGHFVSEHGFYAALAQVQPLIVSAWGSDLLLHPQESWLQRQLVRYALQRSRLVHVVSEGLVEAAQRLGVPRERIVLAYFGVDESWLAMPRRPARHPTIVSTRMFSAVYNLFTVLEAVDRVRLTCPEVRLVLTGAGPLQEALERRVRALGLDRTVEFLGFVDDARMRQLLSEADIYVSAALSDGTSVSLLEAMAAGVLPVVSAIPANQGWIQDGRNGLLFPPHNAERLAQQLVAALQRPEWRAAAAEENRTLVRARALWATQMARVEAAYERIRQ